MIRHITIVLLLAFSTGLFAQKKETSKPRVLKQWSLSEDFSEEVEIPVDTVFSLFHQVKIADKYSPVNATLGNYGLPFYQINFFDRVTDPDKFLYSSYYPLMYIPGKNVFMNTQVPFTEMVWSLGGPKATSEQTFRIRHSQNVNRYFNFGLIYDIVYSLGQYSYQRSEDKNFTFFTSYTGDKYKLYFSAGVNNITSYENGGVSDRSQLTLSDPRDVPVNLGGLNNAISMLKNRNLLLVQRYTIGNSQGVKVDTVTKKRSGLLGLSGTFSHIFIFENNRRTYSDSYPEGGFYDTNFISSTVTFDSLYSRSVKNTLRFDFTTDESRKFRLGGGAGLRNELFRYSQIVPTHDSTSADTSVWNKSNLALVGRLYNNIGDNFRWLATGELVLSGYKSGDFVLNGEISKSFNWKKGKASWLITGGIANRQPSFWYAQWGSNNFEWTNNLNKEFRIDLGSAFTYPARKTVIKFNYAIIDNYTDFDYTAHPSQHTGGLSIAALSLKKEFKAWKFHLASDLLIQKSSNTDVLDLPFFTIRSTGYFEHQFKFKNTGGKLNAQFGAEVVYNTLYHPYAYMPATGRFYRQDELRAGDYPFVNLFLNLKLKRTRIFIMYDHLNSGMNGYNYDMVATYPMNIRMLRYGLAWTFYN